MTKGDREPAGDADMGEVKKNLSIVCVVGAIVTELLVTPAAAKSADLNDDGVVNFKDFAIVAANWLCEANCWGKECGDDGCGGRCGSCRNGLICENYDCVRCDYTEFSRTIDWAWLYSDPNWLKYKGQYPVVSFYVYDLLSISLSQYMGGPVNPGTYFISDNLNGNLKVLLGYRCDCQGSPCEYPDPFIGPFCDKIFAGVSGTLEITSIGGIDEQFSGSLSNVKLIEVWWAEPVGWFAIPDGNSWCLDSYSFDTVIEEPP